MAFEALRKYYAGHLSKRLNVYKIDDFRLIPPETHKLRHSVEAQSMKPEIRAAALRPFEFPGKMKCKAQSVNFSEHNISAKSYKIKRYVKQDIKAYSAQFKHKVRTVDVLKQIQTMPLELENRLKYQKEKPKISRNEMILAWYGPIVDGAVIKLVLNKQRGTLLVWYDPRSRKFSARGVYLIRRLGFGSKPEWRWV